jgi:hypothetical protein
MALVWNAARKLEDRDWRGGTYVAGESSTRLRANCDEVSEIEGAHFGG